jgi:exopolysaccharide biosynthesis polyprenyl glycosylphosphotransferase
MPEELAALASKERTRVLLYLALALLDAASVAAGFLLASSLLPSGPLHWQALDLILLIAPLFVGVAAGNGAYSLEVLESPAIGLGEAIRALLFGLLLVIGFAFYLRASASFSATLFAHGAAVTMLILCIARLAFGEIAGRSFGWSFSNEVTLVDDQPIPQGCKTLVLRADAAALHPASTDPAMFNRIGQLLRNCDRVVLAASPERRMQWTTMLQGLDLDVEVSVPEIDLLGGVTLGHHNGLSTLVIGRAPFALRERFLKRALDLLIATLALLLLAPVMLAAALSIKLESPGPVLFVQDRVGRRNRLFRILKFRSMRSDLADLAGACSAQRSDPRITRVGAFLRRTSIDELPQLINVLAGTMSIVGPRPHALASTAGEQSFWSVDRRYSSRHLIKPGITGLAQVRGFRGATGAVQDLTNRLQSDLDYVAGWSIWRDLAIMLRTFGVLTHRNAF